MLEEVLARARPQEEQVRPDPGGAGLARGPDDSRAAARVGRRSRAGSAPSRRSPSTPASTSAFRALAAAAAGAPSTARSASRPPRRASGSRTSRATSARFAASDEHVEVAHDHRPARDDPERIRRRRGTPRGTRASACTCLRRAGTGRSRRRRVTCSPLPRRRARAPRASTSATFVFTRIERPVAVVRRSVRPLLEGADVTEGAAVHAAHVRVQRPLEAHALHRVEGALAGLFAILDPHGLSREYRTDVRTARRRYSAADAAPADRPEARPLLPRRRDALRHGPRARQTRRGAPWRSSGSRSPTSIPTTSAERRPQPGDRRARSSRAASTMPSASASGERRLAGADRRLVRATRRARAQSLNDLIAQGHAFAPFIRYAVDPDAAVRRQRGRRLAGPRAARSCRRPPRLPRATAC